MNTPTIWQVINHRITKQATRHNLQQLNAGHHNNGTTITTQTGTITIYLKDTTIHYQVLLKRNHNNHHEPINQPTKADINNPQALTQALWDIRSWINHLAKQHNKP